MVCSVEIISDFVKSSPESQTCRGTRCIIEHIGATIIGVKPACLISIQEKDFLAECKKHFTCGSPVSFVIVKGVKTRKQLFIYHKERLESLLSNAEIHTFLVKQGYPEAGTSETYVRLLVRKLRGTQFPHEIGLFLGYPLQDVLGFMGAPIPFSKTMGWRMYGDTRASEKVYFKFRSARRYVRKVMREACQ